MGWYFRKSKSVGPFRINFSNSGVSYSAGVKGARISTGKRGTYVTFGANGIYYRKKIGDHQQPRKSQEFYDLVTSQRHTITSGPVEDLTDTDSQDFVNELNNKANKKSYVNWIGIPLTFIFLLIGFNYANDTVSKEDKVYYTVKVKPENTNVNLRDQPNAKSKVVGQASTYDNYVFVDSLEGWNKIQVGDTGFAYIAGAFSRIDSSVVGTKITTRLDAETKSVGLMLGAGALVCLMMVVYLQRLDKKRLSMEINYEMDEKIKELHGKFSEFFKEGVSSNRIWQIYHSQSTGDWKRNAGAGTLVNRGEVIGYSINKMPAAFFSTNINIPNLSLKGTDMYFFPERLVVKRGNKFAAAFYKNIDIQKRSFRFIEDEAVPGDAQVVDRTWKFLNKNGTPDGRFNNNRQIPICLYSSYMFHSLGGVNETICTSKEGSFDNFSAFIKKIGDLQRQMELD